MHRFGAIVFLTAFTPGMVAPADPPAAAAGKVELKVVKYRELCLAVRSLRGQVVVVDLWADWCVPCKLAFPHLMDLHRHHGKEGLACVSVSLDEVTEQDKALAFLREKEATIHNFLLDEKFDDWQTKFDINGPPALFVFDRDNRLVRRFDHNNPNKTYTHEDVETVVKELLRAK